MQNKFKKHSHFISGVYTLEKVSFRDARGSFTRLFCQTELGEQFGSNTIAQANHSVTEVKGAVRGLHYQKPPFQEVKIVACIKGSVFDVAVDLRPESETFGKWVGQCLSASNGLSLVIPKGCAHGFQTLESDCHLVYFASASFQPESEAGVHPSDPVLSIDWPLPIAQLSAKDNHLPNFETYGQTKETNP